MTARQARVALALSALTGAALGARWVYTSPYLSMTSVEVQGAERLTSSRVREAAAIEGDSIFGLDLAAAEARVAALPLVRSASIERRGWTGALIRIEERTPWGAWRIDTHDVAIDDEGYVLDGPAPAGGPVIVEVQPSGVVNPGDRLDHGAVQLAARLVRESRAVLGMDVQALLYRADAGLTAVLRTGVNTDPVWVTFGDVRDYDYKVAALYVLLEQAKQKELAVTSVDLRFGDRLSFN
jgi:hypothetical protein